MCALCGIVMACMYVACDVYGVVCVCVCSCVSVCGDMVCVVIWCMCMCLISASLFIQSIFPTSRT